MTASDEFEVLPEIYRVKLGDSTTTDQITAGLREPFQFDELISQANFPLKQAKRELEDEIQFVQPLRGFTNEEGIGFLALAGLERPTFEHGIRFAQQHGADKFDFSTAVQLLFFHKPWRGPDRNYHIISVQLYQRSPWLKLRYAQDKYNVWCVVAGVRRRRKFFGDVAPFGIDLERRWISR